MIPKELTLLNLAKELERYKRTLVSFVEKPNITPRKDKDTRRCISPRDMKRYACRFNMEPNGTSTNIFAKFGIDPIYKRQDVSLMR